MHPVLAVALVSTAGGQQGNSMGGARGNATLVEGCQRTVRRTHEHVRHNAVILGQGNWPRECFAGLPQGYGCTALTQTCCNSYGSMKRAKLSCKNTQPRTL